MRKIKFRAWDNEVKKMITPFYVGSELSMLWPPQMQFTGLLDKNGKEIYEGDIIDSPIYNILHGEIVWDRGSFFIKQAISGRMLWSVEHPEDYLEVIGNIYENPELLGS